MFIISTFYRPNNLSEVLYAKSAAELADKIEGATEPFIPGTFAGRCINRHNWEGTTVIPVRLNINPAERWHNPKIGTAPLEGAPRKYMVGLHYEPPRYPGNLLVTNDTLLFLLTGNGVTDVHLYKRLSRRLAMTINGGWFPSKGYDPITAMIDADQSRPVVFRTRPYTLKEIQEVAYVR